MKARGNRELGIGNGEQAAAAPIPHSPSPIPSRLPRRARAGWIGHHLKSTPAQGTISDLRRLGVDVRCVRKLDGPPCEKWDCPRKVCKKRPLWHRPEHEILEVLRTAREKYMAAIKQVHPDRPGGNARAAGNLIAIWERVEKAFAKRGHTLI